MTGSDAVDGAASRADRPSRGARAAFRAAVVAEAAWLLALAWMAVR
jgi:hypothetical protein